MKLSAFALRTALVCCLVASSAPLLAEEPPAASAAPAAAGTPAPAAPRPPAEVTAEAMAKLSFLVGRWEGEGTSRMGQAAAETAQVLELVHSKLGGRALVLEGLGTVASPDGGAPRVAHQAVGVISYDPHRGAYILRAVRSDGQSVDSDVEVGDRRAVWGFAVPQGRIRYTITLDEEGRWQERGEFSPDGTAWHPFFSMTLRRVGDA
jgi:hypothetical protein